MLAFLEMLEQDNEAQDNRLINNKFLTNLEYEAPLEHCLEI